MRRQLPNSSHKGMSLWVVALVLVVVGVVLARLVKAALGPALRRVPMQIELHLV